MVEQPSGTVTLVFTDIEGSTRLLRELGRDAYRQALAEHRRIVREAATRHEGYEVDYEGDAFFYAFGSASEAVAAVAEATVALAGGPIRIRVGIHTGEPGLDPPKYVGIDVHLAARVMAVAHGGQVLLTRATGELVETELKPLGAHRLKDIADPVELYQLGGKTFPPLRTAGMQSLPTVATRFFGRKGELKKLMTLLTAADVRLVTLTGPGGTGKTRLALELGRQLGQKREVLFTDLARSRGERAPLEALAAALRVQEQAAVQLLETVATALDVRAPVVILDNCEHVAAPVARLVEALLQRTRNGKFLATSRRPLRLDGEHRFALAPLSLPPAGDERPERAEAVQLFLDRLRMAAPNIAANTAAVAAATEIVRRLDGLPLAVELAATRAALLGVTEVRDRLDERFRILADSGPENGGRHRSLQATIDVSYEFLDAEAQSAFRTVSVFPGSFSFAAAEAIIGANALELVPSLAEASLLVVEDSGDGSYRYRLLETLRAYAQQKLSDAGESDAAGRSLARWALMTSEAAAAGLDTDAEPQALSRLDQEGDNCAAALEWALGADPAAALSLALALSGWRRRRGRYRETIEALTRATGVAPDAPPGVRARALLELGAAASSLGDLARGEIRAREAAALFGSVDDEPWRIKALCSIAGAQRNQGRLEQAAETAKEALELARQLDDPNGVVVSLTELGFCSVYAADFDDAYNKAKEALEVRDARLSNEATTRRLALLAVAARYLDDLGEMERACTQGLTSATDDRFLYWFKMRLALLRGEQGRRLEALQLLRDTFDFATAVGEAIAMNETLQLFGAWALAGGKLETAALLFGAAEQAFSITVPVGQRDMSDMARAATERELGSDTYAELFDRGRATSTTELLDLVNDLHRHLCADGERGPTPFALFPNWR